MVIKTFISLLIVGCMALAVGACNEPVDRQEQIDRLKGIGLVASPLVNSPSQGSTINATQITGYATIPLGKTPVVTAYLDQPTAGAISVKTDEIIIDASKQELTTYEGFQLLKFVARVTIPSVTLIQRFTDDFQGIQFRYGFTVSTEDDVEYIVGSFLVYPEGSEELQWTNPVISIDSPTENQSLSAEEEFDVIATLTKPNDEDVKLGWYVSEGEISNRRAGETTWTLPTKGKHTLILTARGKKSRGFAIQIKTVNIQ